MYYNIIFKLRIQLSPYRLNHPHCSIFLLAETTECHCIVKRGQGNVQLLWQTTTASLVLRPTRGVWQYVIHRHVPEFNLLLNHVNVYVLVPLHAAIVVLICMLVISLLDNAAVSSIVSFL